MPREIIVEFPSPLTDKEKKMIYGYKGEVVRCKDCKWHEYEEAGMVYCPNMVGSWVGEDGYCSGGERRKDG